MINLLDYINKSKLFQSIEIDDLVAVKYECFINDDRSDIWSHTNYFSFVENGKKRWKTANSDYLLNAGEILFVKKGAHTVYQYFDDPFYVVFIFVDDGFIKRTILKYQEESNLHISPKAATKDLMLVDKNELLKSYHSFINLLFTYDVKSSKSLLKLKIEELILSLLTQPGNYQLKSYFLSLNMNKNSLLEQTMENHFLQPLSIGEFARMCARSLSSFRRDFHKVFKTTPGKWLIRRRVEHSRLLLESTDKSINEIVDMCGFVNRSHFLKIFKQAYHISPSQYREILASKKIR